MVAKKNALGRGLGALIEESPRAEKPVQNEAIKEIAIDKIEVNPFQPRTEFDQEALEELAVSIKELGIIQPITVRQIENGNYQIISGERRTRASKLAGLKTIPAYVRVADDQAMLELALVENIQRQDLDAIEIAISYKRLIDECSLTQQSLSGRVGKQRSTITNYLRLLKLPAEIQKAIRIKVITMGHAKALIGVENIEDQLFLFEMVVKDGLSVRKTEELSKQINEGLNIRETETSPKKKAQPLDENYKLLEQQLKTVFKSGIKLKRNESGKGQIVIPFKNDDELENIIGIMDKLNNK